VEITEVRIKLMEDPGERLKAFCSITFDNCFVVRDLKIIEGSNGPFVAMPSRKLTFHCPECGMKNHLRSQYCNQCGSTLSNEKMPLDSEGRAKLYADIAHPINSACREMIQNRVIREFQEEIDRAKMPGYVSRYDDFDIGEGGSHQETPAAEQRGSRVDPAHKPAAPHESPSSSRSTSSSQDRQNSLQHKHNPSQERDRSNFGDSFGSGIFPEQ